MRPRWLGFGAVCAQCAFDASKAAASAGGAAGLPGLAGAAVAMLGLNRLGAWLSARELRVLRPRVVKIITPLVIWVGLIAFYGVRI